MSIKKKGNKFQDRAWNFLIRNYPRLDLIKEQMPLPRGKRPDFILVEDWPQLALRPDKEQQIVIAEAKYRNSTNLERRDVVQLIEYRKNVEKILKQNVSDTLMIVSKNAKISDTIWDLMEDNYVVLTRLRSM